MKNTTFSPSELTLNAKGKVYHLDLGNDDVADTVILVGDQNRVELVASFFDSITFKAQHREFATITGTYKGRPISAVSHGIGCDNMDIVLTELDAAVNIDLKSRKLKEKQTKLKLVRIGTCGALQEDIKVGTAIISNYAVGMDGVANFYDIPFSDNETEALIAFHKEMNWPNDLVIPYISEANSILVSTLSDLGQKGITVTANGFYGPQGRAIRIPLKHADFKDKLRQFKWDNLQVTNLEMETSALLSLSKALGHNAVTICLVLANRYNNTFDSDFEINMKSLIKNVLDRVVTN
ncbi:MAG: nucleoside phosphorylase [Crocinitomicaceae bacterium]